MAVHPGPGGVIADEQPEVGVTSLVAGPGTGDPAQGYGHSWPLRDGSIGTRSGFDRHGSAGGQGVDDGPGGDGPCLEDHHVLGDQVRWYEARPVDAERLGRTAPD